MVDQTDSVVDIAQFLFDQLDDNKTPLGLTDVFYGDQEKIPRVPAVAVESGTKSREINGAPRRTLNTITAYLIIYHSKIDASVQVTRKEVDLLAEAVESLVHSNSTMDGLVIHSLVTEIQSGYSAKGKTDIYRSARLTVTATSQSQLPLAR